MQQLCTKPGSLKFGIDTILQNPSHDQLQLRKDSKIHDSTVTFSAQVSGNSYLLPTSATPTIDHFYGCSSSRPTTQSVFSNTAPGFMWNSSAHCNAEVMDHHYYLTCADYNYTHDIPSVVQRVPLAVSYRKTEMSSDFAKNYRTAETPAKSGKRKKSWTRAVFSSLQRKGLERSFFAQQYISKKDRRKLAATLGLTDSQVRIWYANRRMKSKKADSRSSSQHNI